MTKPLNTGLVAVPAMGTGQFFIYMTGGLFDPRRWITGRLGGSHVVESRAELEALARQAGRRLVKHRDYFQLAPIGEESAHG